ncbi:hypothetical protein BWQ96_04693 [Gracilariopsis chorda]|uniref:Uncharacterized protein n=1 Tax=Gracilariopsis chorda TaxID=448386 RepID=A0A2V3ITV4_9FLOR|nr:hypothetical protein BWQ96_04693 [Gracilariopsis chorda]|eukprot:PXF45555.1 hypothetical protein BWQ96_04693 [Gracilariopsis chorda]
MHTSFLTSNYVTTRDGESTSPCADGSGPDSVLDCTDESCKDSALGSGDDLGVDSALGFIGNTAIGEGLAALDAEFVGAGVANSTVRVAAGVGVFSESHVSSLTQYRSPCSSVESHTNPTWQLSSELHVGPVTDGLVTGVFVAKQVPNEKLPPFSQSESDIQAGVMQIEAEHV